VNRSYRTVWNAALGAFVAVAEKTRSGGKRQTRTSHASLQSDASIGNNVALSCVAAAVALLAVVPNAALAANECGTPAAGGASVTCSGASYASGITYSYADDFSITLNNPAMSIANPGLSVTLTNPGGLDAATLVVNASNLGTVTSSGVAVSVVNNRNNGSVEFTMDSGLVTSSVASRTVQVQGLGATNVSTTLNGGRIVNTGTGVGFYSQSSGINSGASLNSLTINGGSVEASNIAASVFVASPVSLGSGSAIVNGGSVLSTNSTGLQVDVRGSGKAQLQMTGGTVTGQGANGDGIYVTSRSGTFAASMAGGTVNGGGGTGAALHVAALNGGTVDIGAGATLNAGASGVALRIGATGQQGNATITTAGTLNGAVVLGSGADVLTIAGGAINGNITGDNTDALRFDLGTNSFTHGAGYAINGLDSVTMVSGTARIDSAMSINKLSVDGGTLVLGSANSYIGATNVNGGTLRAGAANVFSAASAHTVAAGGTLDLAGFSQTLTTLSNAGTVSLPGGTPGNTLTITGAYVGNGGTLRLGTALGDSSSASDRLVLSGASASASGNTRIQVTNLGGLGALTTGNGIEVVTATNGANTTAQSTKDAFSLAGGYVDAGAYEYRLYAADANGAGENWYLRSSVIPVVMDPELPRGPVPTYRAEVPLYAVVPEQFREFDFAMLGNLHQRVGDERTAAATGNAWGGRQGWGRIISVDRDIAQQGTVSPTSSGRLNGFQTGTDLWANPNWRTGLYAGQLEGDMDVNGFARGVVNYAAGRNDLRSQYLGAYATWMQSSGLYVDSVLQAGRHRYTAYPSQGQASSGKGDSVLASVEAGTSLPIAAGWAVEPQLQLAYQHLGLDDTSISGASIQQDVDNGWIVRAGVRVKGSFDAGPGTLQPYARVNFYKRSSGTDITRFIGPAGSTDIASRTGGTSSELAAGATWALSQTTSLYGELGKMWDLGGDARTSSGVSGSVGVKVLW